MVYMPETGSMAPNFRLEDGNGTVHTLSDFAGKKLVLYFYPKDGTSGCTKQALVFKEAYEKIKEKGAEVVGVSRDSAASHARFAGKNGLPFILLSDPELEAIKAYGVWKEKKNYGKTVMGVVRTTFIIDEDGRIEKVMEKVRPDANAWDVLEAL